MKTFPLLRADGTQFAFEVRNKPFSLSPILKILHSVEGVEDIKRVKGSDDLITFKYAGVPFVVNEPWGDNSRYWVGPVKPDNLSVDISVLHEAFLCYQGFFSRLAKGACNVCHD